jgi:dTMP kinase
LQGRLITFEGGEGAGKSTQARLLADRLTAGGTTVVVTREPGGTPFAEKVRDLVLSAAEPRSALSEALLFSAARADHVERLIRPSLQRGAWVISDRFLDSTRAYQGAAGGVAKETLLQLEALAVGETRPDLTVVLDLPVAVGLARANARRQSLGGTDTAADAFETRRAAFHERLREGFLAIAAAEPVRCAVVDGTLPPDRIAEVVWQLVAGRLLAGRR